jgi:3-hydroxybutyrate dehydrogenase
MMNSLESLPIEVSPAQLGGTVAFLCSEAASQITGTAISVDGGWTAQ